MPPLHSWRAGAARTGLAAVLAVLLGTGAALGQAGMRPKVNTVSSSLPTLAITPVGTVPESVIGGSGIGGFTVSPSGLLAVDNGASQVTIVTSSGGKLRTIGRGGSGPGEFSRGGVLIGWLQDTLVVVDNGLRRISLFRPQTGALLATLPQGAKTRPRSLAAAGSKLYVISAMRMAERRARPNTPEILFPVLMSAVTPLTSTGIGPRISALTDSINEVDGFDCENDRGGWDITGFFPDHGPLVTVLPGPRLVTAVRDSFLITIRDPASTTPATLIRHASPRLRVPKEVWDSLTAPFRDARGGLRCGKESQRPEFLPAIRAVQGDALGRLWVETTNARGTEMQVISPTGVGIGRFAMPLHDESVPWQVQNGVVYFVVADGDGLQAIRSFRVSLP